ncbi:MalM family protein [Marinobacter sp. CHS3-4]|uniref:MalM family protein n=1 Tax=Marinobacter sp. CHS3-4 TaxID=3045174 RepID=UPI0024B5EE8D|nr:MalM family protein [Marinobacter sp. CHS3-4]MDI9245728.1 MalM family protein [Marinobacter sp. CHS3-4]
MNRQSRIEGFMLAVSLTALLSGCQLMNSEPSGAKDGYFTWVDEQGQVRQTRIPDTSEPIESVVAKGSEPRATGSDTSEPPHEEYNLENYPDGNELAERGFLREGDPEPYFTWRDAQGNVRVSYYRPDTRTAVEKGEIEPPLQLTRASIYEAGSESVDGDLPEGADPLASAVLGLDGGVAPFFERWSRNCCESLNRSDYVQWDMGREFGVDVTEVSPRHEFLDGPSHYRLVSLPLSLADQKEAEKLERPVARDFILRLRSFDQKGLFVPSVAFLDRDFKPVRLVTDLAAEYVPESWARHGHLRSYIPVFPTRGERWMLIYTTGQDLAEQTVIETRFGPRAIQHQPTGQLGLMRVEQ